VTETKPAGAGPQVHPSRVQREIKKIPNQRFSRIKESDVIYHAPELMDNSFDNRVSHLL
jgi:hypothetical protein